MKKALTLLLLLPILGIAQIKNPETIKSTGAIKKADSIGNGPFVNIDTFTVGKTQRIQFTQSANNKLINQYLGKIVGTTNKADQLGNYASFDPALATLAFKGTIPIGKPSSTRFSYLGIGINGDLVSNGVAALFNNSKLNTNIGIQLDYSFRLWKTVVRRDVGLFNDYLTKVALSNLSMDRKLDNLPDNSQIYIDYFSDLKDVERLGTDVEFYQDALSRAKVIVDGLNRDRMRNINIAQALTDSNKVYLEKKSENISPVKKEEYEKKIKDNNQKLDSLRQHTKDNQKNYNTADYIYEQQKAKLTEVKKIYDPIKQKTDSVAVIIKSLRYRNIGLGNKINAMRKKVEDSLFSKLEFRGINISYFTVTAASSQKEYYTFDKKLAFGSQLNKQAFTTFRFGLAWNSYDANISDNRYIFYRISGAYLRDNNTDQYSTMALAQETVIKNTAGDTTRKVSKTYNVYTDALTSTKKLNLSADFYYLFGKRTSGFHLSASYYKPEKLRNYTDLSLGYLVSLQSLKKDDPLINVEVYYKFADAYDNRDTGIAFWQRNEIGFKVGLPFSLLKK